MNRIVSKSNLLTIKWPKFQPIESWFNQIKAQSYKQKFDENGYTIIPDIIPPECLPIYQKCYSILMKNEINCKKHRHDLGAHNSQTQTGTDNTGQIMWPSLYFTNIHDGPLHQRSLALNKLFSGDDMVFDFDHLIFKEGQTKTETPWHQDEAYWPTMEDKRATSCWVAMDDTTVENGCIWFIPKSHLKILPHRPVAEGKHI